METLVLSFDIGTQSIRAILAKKDGSFLDKIQYNYEKPYFSDHPFWAEQTPFFYYDALCRVSKEILDAHPEALSAILCVTVTTIRDTVICLGQDNEPISNYILWLDKREAAYEPEKIPVMNRLLVKMVGMQETIEYQYRDTKANWIMQHEPELWGRTKTYAYLSTHMNYLLTGNLRDSIGSVIGHMPFDYKARTWMKKNNLTYAVYAVPEEKLFPVVEPGEVLGHISAQASKATGIPEGLKVIATGSDKGCETVGMSVMGPGSAAISFGTSSTIQIANTRYIEPQPFMPAYPAAIPGTFNPEIQIYRGYWMMSWYINEFCYKEIVECAEKGIKIEKFMDTQLGFIPAGSGGLMIQPYWTPGVATPSARGCMVGFNDRQNKYYIYRAILEGINYELMCAKKTLERQSGIPITELYVAGGGAKSPEVLQMTADMFGLPVKKIQTHEASGLGTSLIGFVACGEFKDYEEAAKAMIHTATVYTPDPEQHEIYKQYFAIYEKLYGRLKPVYRQDKIIDRRMGNV